MKENAYEAPERPELDDRRRLIVASAIGVTLAGPVAYINFYCLTVLLWVGIDPMLGWPLIAEPVLAALAFVAGIITLRRRVSMAIAWGLIFSVAIPFIFLSLAIRQLE